MRSLALLLLLVTAVAPAPAQTIEDLRQDPPRRISLDDFRAILAQTDVLYLGERHDRAEDHQAQRTLLEEYHRQRGRVGVGFEMVTRPYQSVLDRFGSRETPIEKLPEALVWPRQWGFAWEFYAPLFQYALDQRLPMVALNAPRETVRAVARLGLEGARPDLTGLPAPETFEKGPDDYRRRLSETYKEHGKDPSEPEFDHFFEAQLLWDETMADSIRTFRALHPSTGLAVIVGAGHVHYGHGIPRRVARREGERQLRVLLVDAPPRRGEQPAGDFLWIQPARKLAHPLVHARRAPESGWAPRNCARTPRTPP